MIFFILLRIFFGLLIGHAVCDYPLQGDFLSKGKNRYREPSKIFETNGSLSSSTTNFMPWWICLAAHAGIHAGAVWLITGRWWLGLAEFCVHAWIDDSKCAGKISPVTDQGLHVMCKALWVLGVSYSWVVL